MKGDLFSVPDHVALAHCVSADMAMGKGIAVLFRDKFKNVEKLKSQGIKIYIFLASLANGRFPENSKSILIFVKSKGKKPGECAYLVDEKGRFVFYLVTKERYFQRPSYETLKSSLTQMRQLIETNDVRELAMPRIGCGLDGLQWPQVRRVIDQAFADSAVNIRIYEFDNSSKKPANMKS